MNPEQKMDLGSLVKNKVGQPYKLTIPLDQAVADLEFPLAGRVLAVWTAPDSTAYVDIKFNRQNEDSIRFTRGRVLAVPFTKLFITVPAGGGAGTVMELLYGPDAFEVLRIYPTVPDYDTTLDDVLTRLTEILAELETKGGIAQPEINITNVAADANTVGANHACTAVLIRAFTTNTGLVWVNFQAAGVDGTSYPLAAGDAISVPLTNTNLINCLFKVANETVAVIYQV